MEKILGYDCDDTPIIEFRILRFPFSAEIDDWSEEPNIDPRFYCAVESANGEYYAISVYDNYNSTFIRRYEKLSIEEEIPTLVIPISERENYEVAFSGITGEEWYYDRDRQELKEKLETILKSQNVLIKTKNKRYQK